MKKIRNGITRKKNQPIITIVWRNCEINIFYFVIWNDHPLSTSAICEQTWIDGIQFFSRDTDTKLKQRDTELRNQLVNKILSKKSDEKKKWNHKEEKSANHLHCLEKL